MSIFKRHKSSEIAEQLHAEQDYRRRAARSRNSDQLRDPMATVVMRSMY